MEISQHEVSQFADWTGDCNPIHVDPDAAKASAFGGNIVHGALSAIVACRQTVATEGWEGIRRLDIEFRSEIRPGNAYTLLDRSEPGQIDLSVEDGDALRMLIQGSVDQLAVREENERVEWLPFALSGSLASNRDQPDDWSPDSFREGSHFHGVHEFGEASPTGLWRSLAEKVLGLSSYMVGMKAPGLSSLFTKLSLAIHHELSPERLAYRLTFKGYDSHFRLLETTLEVADESGRFLATAEMQSYVRFPQRKPDPERYVDLFDDAAASLEGKVALVCGASRGLGAELAAALGAAKCHVYLASRTPNESTETLRQLINQQGGSAEVVQGDVGDSAWCALTRSRIEAEHGGLDLLILNACGTPRPQRVGVSEISDSPDYISTNVALWKQPLSAFLPAINVRCGTVVAISTSFVEELPPGFADYVAVKMAMEAAMRTAAHEHPESRFVISRPPKLQTSWNDIPTSAMGAIPVWWAAKRTIDSVIAKDAENLSVVSEFTLPHESTPQVERPVDLELTLSATFTLDPIQSGFDGWNDALELHFGVQHAPYAQVLQQSLDPGSALSGTTGGAVILLRVSDWLREWSPDLLDDANETAKRMWETCQEYIDAIKAHRAVAAAPTLLLLCPSTPGQLIGDSLIAEIERTLRDALNDVPGLTFERVSDWHTCYDIQSEAVFDELREGIAHIPYQDAYYDFLATLIVRFFYRRVIPPKKVVVLDCDNTLWGGVVGEAGPEGIELTPTHHALHDRLNELAACGVLICLCSKNEEADVWAVFEQREDFTLNREIIVAAAINWLPKSQNIQGLAQTLNLGMDSFLFLDDNPVECAEVRAACPDVLTIQWPQEEASASKLLAHLWELDAHASTAEDKKRTQQYKEEFRRQQSEQSAGSFQEFIDSLELVFDSRELDEEDLPRASQLTMRTNQFNFTTIRRTEVELKQLINDPGHVLRTIRVRDRFGDYGLVGFFIGRVLDDALLLDTFLLSCRVLGRGVEYRMAAELGQIAQERGVPVVRWPHVPTERNTPARMFLQLLSGDMLPEDSSVECEFVADAAALAETRFQAEDREQAEKIRKATEKKPQQKLSSGRLSTRQRENQIQRSWEQLSSAAAISRHFGNESAVPATALNGSDVADFVYQTFADKLKRDPAEIRQVDRLDALGCDSLRIVEITVALSREYAWLPKTLLFEHPSVSGIVDAIVELAQGSETAVTPAVRSMDADRRDTSDLAIVGIGVHCAGARTVDELWMLLSAGRSAVRRVPKSRSSFVGQLDDQRDHFAGLIDDAADFDADFFGISPREAEYLDPQLRILLQNAYHALEDAGMANDPTHATMGVFVGAMYTGYARFANAVAAQTGSLYRCWEIFSLANRMSQVLRCHGPSLSIDTACSSSATALHYACESLRRGDCESALVSGVNLIIDPNRLVQLGRLGILSPSGNCVPFGAGADGTVLGEGAVSIVVRPLSSAIADNDRIYSVIKGTGISSGAGSVGFTAPNPTAQSEATRRAFASSGVDPRTVTYIESHGTGTELGDPIEVRGLEMAYRDRSLWDSNLDINHHCTLGSIKPNVGHLEAGAGLMGVVKASLQLHHRTLVPSITASEPNPQISFADLPFDIQRDRVSWIRQTGVSKSGTVEIPLRAGVNSFGVGGSNIHVILEQSPSPDPEIEADIDRSVHLLPLSAKSSRALQQQVDSWAAMLENDDVARVADRCFSAATGQVHYPNRVAVVLPAGDSASDAFGRAIFGERLGTNELDSSPNAPSIVGMLFTGQGAQYPTMTSTLYHESPVFAEAFRECVRRMGGLLPRPLDEVIFSGAIADGDHPIHQTGFTQPALFAVQYALFQLWRSWGITPDYVMGHSIGEIAAYCVADGCSLDDAVRMVVARGQLMQSLPSGGAMCSLATDATTVQKTLDDRGNRVSIAAINGPQQTVISGPLNEVEGIAKQFEAGGVSVTRLSVSHAFHSQLMDPMLNDFAEVLSQLDLRSPRSPIVSSATGKVVDGEMATPQYWLDQVRQPVRFVDAMNTLDGCGVTHYLEIGPHPVMVAMGRKCLPDSSARWLASARRGHGDWQTALSSLATFYVDGFDVDWNAYDRPYHRRRISTPGYQFDSQRTWIAELESTEFAYAPSRHTTGDAEEVEQACYEMSWQPKRADASGPKHGKWLILSTESMPASDLARFAQTKGISCQQVLLKLGSSSENAAACTSKEQLGALVSEGNDFDRVVFVARSSDENSEDADGVMDANRENLWQLCQVIGGLETSPLPKRSFWLVTNHAVSAVEGDHFQRGQGTLWGLGRVAGLEWPETWGGIIDVGDWSGDLDALIAEISDSGEEDQIAIRGERRLVPRLNPMEQPEASTEQIVARLKLKEGAVLITGGLGGLGLKLADWLSQHGAGHLVLVSRRGDDGQRGADELQRIRDRGTNVQIIAADVSDESGVRDCLDAVRPTPVHAVFHAAGVDLEKPIGETTVEDIERVLNAKVKGACLLDRMLPSEQVKAFVCFSSISSVWGSAGRSLYAAANSFLDGLMHDRNARGQTSLSINFGPWAGAGMANEHAIESLARMGNYGLNPDEACAVLCASIALGQPQVTIAKVDWQRFLPVVESRRTRPLLSALKVLRENAGPAQSAVGDGQATWCQRLQGAAESDRLDRVGQWIAEEVARLLRIKDVGAVAKDRNLYELGMDSLTSAELTTALRKKSGISQLNVLSGRPTIGGLANAVVEQMPQGRISDGGNESADGCPPKSAIAGLSKNDVVKILKEELARVTGRRDLDAIGAKRPLVELGVDSLSSVEFANRIRTRFHLDRAPQVLGFPHLNAIADQLTDELPQPTSSPIVHYKTGMESTIFKFVGKAWPNRRREWIEPRWTWMFVDSARRLGVEPKVWLYRDDGKIVGHHGAQFVRLKVGKKELTTAWFVDTMVLESHRGLGVGTQLVLKSIDEMPTNLSLGQTKEMRSILENIGWKRVGPLQTYVLALNPRNMLKNKVPGAVAPIAAAFLSFKGGTRRALRGRSSLEVSVEPVDRYGVVHDELWERVSEWYSCSVVRDASYLNWKYIDQPGQEFVRLDFSSGGKLVGTVVLSFQEPNQVYQYRRASIIEMVVRPDGQDLMALVDGVVQYCRDNGADAVFMHLINDSIAQALENAGFIRRDATRHLVVAWNEGFGADLVFDPRQWLITQGDSDIDRPW